MRPSKAIVIDPFRKEVSEAMLETYEDINDIIGDTFCLGPVLRNGDSIYVDDNGLFKETHEFFLFDGAIQPLAGLGVVSGVDRYGETVDVKSSVEDIRSMVSWIDRHTAMKFIRDYNLDKHKIISLSDSDFEKLMRGEF